MDKSESSKAVFLTILNHIIDDSDVNEELQQIYKHVTNESSSPVPKLSQKAIDHVSNRLETDPFPTVELIHRLLRLYDDKCVENDDVLQSIYVETIRKFLSELKKSNDEEISHVENKLYSLLAQYKLTKKIALNREEFSDVLDDLLSLPQKNVYLSLLGQQNLQLLRIYEEYRDKKGGLKNENDLFRHYLTTKEHWLLTFLESTESTNYLKNTKIINFIKLLRIFKRLQTIQTQLECNPEKQALKKSQSLSVIHSDSKIMRTHSLGAKDVEVKHKNLNFALELDYLCSELTLEIPANEIVFDQSNSRMFIDQIALELRRERDILKHIIKYSRVPIPQTTCLNVICQESCLGILSRFTDLHDKNQWPDVSTLLASNNEILGEIFDGKNDVWDESTFAMFKILIQIIDCIHSNKIASSQVYFTTITRTLQKCKVDILNGLTYKQQLQILQNIFALIFVRYEHFNSTDNHESLGFVVSDSVLRDVVLMLKELTISISVRLGEAISELVNGESNETDGKTSDSLGNDLETLRKLKNDFQRLSVDLMEGLWRIELLAGSGFLEDEGAFNPEPIKYTFCKCDTNYRTYKFFDVPESSDDEQKIIQPVKRRRKSNRRSDANSSESSEPTGHNYRNRFFRRTSSSGNQVGESKCLLNFLLAPVDSLLYLVCDDDKKTEQVIKMYGSEMDETVVKNIRFSRSFKQLRGNVEKLFVDVRQTQTTDRLETNELTLKNIQKLTNASYDTLKVINLIETFFSNNHEHYNHVDNYLEKYSSVYPPLKNFINSNDVVFSIFDLLLTTGSHNTHSETLLKCLYRHANHFENQLDSGESKSNVFGDLIKRYRLVQEKLKFDWAFNRVVLDSRFNLPNKAMASKLVFLNNLNSLYEDLTQSLTSRASDNILNETIKCFNGREVVQSNRDGVKSRQNYLLKLQTYLKLVLSVINGALPTKNLLSLVHLSYTDILKQLIYVKRMQPADLEGDFNKIKLNLAYYLVLMHMGKIDVSMKDRPDDVNYRRNFRDFFRKFCERHSKENGESKQFINDHFSLSISEINEKSGEESTQKSVKNEPIIPTAQTLRYILEKNDLVGFIVGKAYEKDLPSDILSTINTHNDRGAIILRYFQVLNDKPNKILYANNLVFTALHQTVTTARFFDYFFSQTEYKDIDPLSLINTLIESIPERQIKSNGNAENDNWQQIHDLVLFYTVKNNYKNDLSAFLTERIHSTPLRVECVLANIKHWQGKYVIKILKGLLTAFETVTDNVLIANWLNKVTLYDEIAKGVGCSIWFDVYATCEMGVFDPEADVEWSPEMVFRTLVGNAQYKTLLKWFKHSIKPTVIDLIDATCIEKLLDSAFDDDKTIENTNIVVIQKIFDGMAIEQVQCVINDFLVSSRNISHMSYVIEYVIERDKSKKPCYVNTLVSLNILSLLNINVGSSMWCLVGEPLLIMEQLLMNTRLEKLGEIIAKVKPFLSSASMSELTGDGNDVNITVEEIDSLLRKYAGIALKFDNINQRKSDTTSELHTPAPSLATIGDDTKLLQSIDSANLLINTDSSDQDAKDALLFGDDAFQLPERIPSVEEWIPNHIARICMCCKSTVFTMFHRRHHCRRCGRVVCGDCSKKRVKLETEILVRVCDQCYCLLTKTDQSEGDFQTEMINSVVSLGDSFWQLTDNYELNEKIRNEFSYEYAPSVSLCLSIMKLHSPNAKYARFLMDQSNGLMSEILPKNPGQMNDEIDYILVIDMLKSLLIAAKVGCVRCGDDGGLAQCDLLLSQTDLLTMLAQNGCLHLLPFASSDSFYGGNRFMTGSPLNGIGLMRLIDKLLENEYWSLCLDIATKTGLDKTGIFAAWGKTCLKSGCFEKARKVFKYCLDEVFDDVSIPDDDTPSSSYHNQLQIPKRRRYSTENRLSIGSNISLRTYKHQPPLVNEIVSTLEGFGGLRLMAPTTVLDSRKLLERKKLLKAPRNQTISFSETDAAVITLNKVANLENILKGNYTMYKGSNTTNSTLEPTKNPSDIPNKPRHCKKCRYLDPQIYNECLFYLNTYGSHSGIIQFLLEHHDIPGVLNHVLNAGPRIDRDIYVEIYMFCLKRDLIEELWRCLNDIDATLEKWKDGLLFICAYLDQNKYTHTLYQLQQWMSDNVRASMTCIQFYKSNCRTYTELFGNLRHLYKAQEHLKRELDIECVVQNHWVYIENHRTRLASIDGEKPQTKRQTSINSLNSDGKETATLVLKIDSRDIDVHINTITLQIEVTKFLFDCEKNGVNIRKTLPELFDQLLLVEKGHQTQMIPTLFDTKLDRLKVAALVIACGKNVNDGFGSAFRIITNYKLDACRVYCIVGKYLARQKRYSEITRLVTIIKTSGINADLSTTMCDEVLTVAVNTMARHAPTNADIEPLVKLMDNLSLKISAYIECKQLKSAYLLAARAQRRRDVKRIMREAEKTNQNHIRSICAKWLAQNDDGDKVNAAMVKSGNSDI